MKALRFCCKVFSSVRDCEGVPMLQHGSQPRSGRTPLLAAARNGRLDLVRTLCAFGGPEGVVGCWEGAIWPL